MRFLAVLALSTVPFAVPQMVAADPGAAQTDQTATPAQPAAPASPSAATATPAQVTPATPAQSAPQVAQTATGAEPASNPDEIVCKMTPPTTGTRLGGGRECHTAREWDNRRKDAQRNTNDSELRGLQPARLPGG